MSIAALLLVMCPAAQAPIDAGRAAQEILDRGNYQRELPRLDGPMGSSGGTGDGELEPDAGERRRLRPREEDAAGGRARRPDARRGRQEWSLALPPELARAIGVLLLAGVVIAGVVWLLRARGGRDVKFDERAERSSETADAPRFDALTLEEAERLAREGRFAEAIRALLHRSFEALRGREGVRLEPWRTSREVLAAARLPAAQRASLGKLVDAVERSLFARREPGVEEFEACAREYRALLASDGGAARG